MLGPIALEPSLDAPVEGPGGCRWSRSTVSPRRRRPVVRCVRKRNPSYVGVHVPCNDSTTPSLQLIKKLAGFSFVQLDDDTIVLSQLLPLSPSLPPKQARYCTANRHRQNPEHHELIESRTSTQLTHRDPHRTRRLHSQMSRTTQVTSTRRSSSTSYERIASIDAGLRAASNSLFVRFLPVL